jgi:hypothetical protein
MNLVAVKQALINVLAAAVTAAEENQVQVAYSWPGKRAERECVHGGLVEWEQSSGGIAAGDDTASVTMLIHVVISHPGATVAETDARATAIGAVLEAGLIADDTLGGQAGVMSARVAGGDLDHGEDDDGASSVLTLRIALRCYQP